MNISILTYRAMDVTQRFWLLCCLITILSLINFAESCSSIPLSDVKLAVTVANATYDDVILNGRVVPDTIFKVVKVEAIKLKDEPLKAVVATSGNTTVVCFRGTISKKQLYDQLHSTLTPATLLHYGEYKIYVTSYFWDALELFNPGKLIPGGIQTGGKYIITGHSLGGTLASLFALYMKVKHPGVWSNPDITLITFGAPRGGDETYAKAHDTLIPPSRKLRFIHHYDIVPHIPSKPLYTHHSREVWIWKKPEIMWWWVGWKHYWTICKFGDNPSGCSTDMSYYQIISNVYLGKIAHQMKWYQQAINSPPNSFYDKNGILRWTFEDAQCK